MNKLILLTPLLLLMLMGIAGATTPSAIPSGIQYYVPINLTNSQTTATASPFQQMVNITESTYSSYIAYSGSTANFEYFYSNGTIIPAWIESNSSGKLVTWVKTISIPASSHIQVYLGFASKTTNLLSSSGTSGIGEAPQLSSTYAQYDDGASVFPVYYNFAGTTLDSRISTISGATLTQNNGLTIAASTTSTTFYILTTSQTTSPAILEADETYYGVGTGTNSNEQYGLVMDSSTSTSQNTGGLPGGTNYMARIINNGGASPQIMNGGTTLASGTLSYISQYTAIDSFIQTPSGLSATFDGTTTSASTTALTSGYLGFYIYSASANSNVAFVQWLRTRAYPPSGTMPSTSLGNVTSNIITITYSSESETYTIPTSISQPISYSESSTESSISTVLVDGSLSQTIQYSEKGTYSIPTTITNPPITYKDLEDTHIEAKADIIISYSEKQSEVLKYTYDVPTIQYSEQEQYFILEMNPTASGTGVLSDNLYAFIPFNSSSFPSSISYNLYATYLPAKTNVQSVSSSLSTQVPLSFSFTVSASADTTTYVVTATVEDSASTVIPNATVTWTATGGTVSPTTSTTNSSGQATTTASGASVTVTASVTLLGVTETASATT